MPKEKEIKYITKEINFIITLEKPKQFTIESENNLNGKKARLRKQAPNKYSLHVKSDLDFDLILGSSINIKLSNQELNLNVERASVKGLAGSFSASKYFFSCEIKIYSFQSKNLSLDNLYYCKQIIPIRENTHFFYKIDDFTYSSDKSTFSRGLLKIQLAGENKFEAYITKVEEKDYLIIESRQKLTPENFKSFTWPIIISLSYFMGYLMQDECYFFYYEQKDTNTFNSFEYKQLRDSIRTSYTPINSNPYGWDLNNSIAKDYEGKLTNISQKQFSELCKRTYSDIEIEGIILLILESSSRSLVLMPAGLSVALESLTQYFSDKHPEILRPIPEKQVSDSFKTELREVLLSYKDKIKSQGLEILKNKINDINNPTNSEKLKAPFKIFNVALTEIDEKVLSHRNDFLHGNITLKGKKGKEYSMESFEISLRLITLLNIIILKMIGYEGYILNHAKLQEKGIGKIIDEEPFRKI